MGNEKKFVTVGFFALALIPSIYFLNAGSLVIFTITLPVLLLISLICGFIVIFSKNRIEQNSDIKNEKELLKSKLSHENKSLGFLIIAIATAIIIFVYKAIQAFKLM